MSVMEARYPADDGDRTFDVTDTCFQIFWVLTCPVTWAAICPGVLGSKILVLEAEEAVLKQDCCLYHSVAHRSYGELGSVEKQNYCCCVGFTTDLSSTRENGGKAAIIPGFGCDTALVDMIVGELKARMKSRGDTGQMKKAEDNLYQIKLLHTKIDAVMTHLQIRPVEVPAPMDR